MDFQTPLICAGVVAVTSAAVYLSSVFGIRERTYEEAIEEQRRRNSLDISLKPNKSVDKPKKEKKEKKKDKPNKKEKSKDKSTNGSQPQQPSVEHKATVKESVRKTEHAVGFKSEPEVVVLSDEPEDVDISKLRKTSYDKPIKPILMNKSEQNIDLSQVFNQTVTGRNSFDQILPKDDFELLKDSSKKSIDSEHMEPMAEPIVEKTIAYNMTSAPLALSAVNNFYDNDISQQLVTDVDNKVEVLRTENSENSSPARKSRKWKQNSLEGNGREVSAKTIIEIVKTVTLNNEEIQLLTDILLNKQSDGSTEWRKKNDPLAVLKKQLQEKEVALEKAMKNLSTAVVLKLTTLYRRGNRQEFFVEVLFLHRELFRYFLNSCRQQKTRELRNELEVEKSKQLNSRDKSQQMQLEVQALHMKLQQSYESQRNEMNSMQKQLQQIQVKCNEERTHAIRLQEDNSRLQQLVKGEQHVKHEVDQLRTERQQYEIRMSATQKTNEELIRKTQQLENRIKSMSDSRLKDETSYQKHVKDVSQELQKCETQRNALVDELSHTTNKCNSLESENLQFIQRFKDLEENKNTEIKRLIDDMSEINKQKLIIEKALTEAKQHEQQNGDQNLERQEFMKLNEEMIATKEELRNTKNAFENQLRKHEELGDKYRLANESIANFDKVKKEFVESALKVSEEANRQLKTENETFRQQNESLNTKLVDTSNCNKDSVREVDSIKTALRTVIPSLDTESKDWISRIQTTLSDQLSHRSDKSSGADQQRVEALESLLNSEKEKSSQLETKCAEFASTLSQTESILSELENKMESQEGDLKKREKEFESELKTHSTQNAKLGEEIKRLESSLVQFQEFKETFTEMEDKLKELQSKLSGEENEKRLLEHKYDEVCKKGQATKNASVLKQELDEFESERSELDKMKAELEELKTSLDKEKKISKDLNLQNVRLNSLVKIGHESLKMEEDRVRQLQSQLNLNNGALSAPVNGSSDTNANNCLNQNSDNTQEAASAKK
ncbi:unnamed protein product [Oppiella nova]|uniref:Uncharacterized protein n=1 Tax=Oppiella nova TaxID=334625 RepID=A0A7R9LS01_9ACAR|nr:unnamed protein product [Oppiella nova]CAG2166396.1 unnamed protein product [Oppiella nova]